jgi:hypothetical protein
MLIMETQVSKLTMMSYEGDGNVVQCNSVCEMKGISNIIKNDLGEVKMALEESDVTNGLKGLEFKPIEMV